MSGVIDSKGQWEHCGECNAFVLIQHLCYEPKTAEHPYGRDLCRKCFIKFCLVCHKRFDVGDLVVAAYKSHTRRVVVSRTHHSCVFPVADAGVAS